ncbi:MAG: hypothetical protein J2P36_21680 [Ktedonobacteraceae bacterium]|nr:hypothetical protein [Ktedonobacteraceae bacterium]
MTNERYQHELWTGSGSTKASLQFQEPGDIECELHMRSMGADECHYHLTGRYERLSDTYGRIFIQQISVQCVDRASSGAQSSPPSEKKAEEVDLTTLGTDLIYEYIKVDRSPVFYHPDEDLTLMSPLGYAGWNEFFDLLLITDPFIVQTVDTFNDAEEAPDERLQGHWRNVVYVLDKLKFAKIMESS